MAASLTKAMGREVFYNAADPDVYRDFGFQGVDEIGNIFQFNRDSNKVLLRYPRSGLYPETEFGTSDLRRVAFKKWKENSSGLKATR